MFASGEPGSMILMKLSTISITIVFSFADFLSNFFVNSA